jgi:hypothetical protein
MNASRGQRAVQVGLVAVGLGMLGWGVRQLSVLRPPARENLLTWLVAGLVLHDGVLVPAVTLLTLGGGLLARRLTDRPASGGVAARRWRVLPGAPAWVVTGLVVGGVLTLVVLPEVHAKHLGTANPTVLPHDYGLRLAIAWAVIAVVVGVAVALLSLREQARRGRARRTSDHPDATASGRSGPRPPRAG